MTDWLVIVLLVLVVGLVLAALFGPTTHPRKKENRP